MLAMKNTPLPRPYFLCGYSPKELPGREQQLAFMNDHATREGSVVFLHGTPGTGKTALVSRVAEKHFLYVPLFSPSPVLLDVFTTLVLQQEVTHPGPDVHLLTQHACHA